MKWHWKWLLAVLAFIAFVGANLPYFWTTFTYREWENNPRTTIGGLLIILHSWGGHNEFVFIKGDSTRTFNYDAIGTICWMVFFALALPFVVWGIARKMSQQKPNVPRCAKCGRDASRNINGRCPACGALTRIEQ
jgi:hypothetical protein